MIGQLLWLGEGRARQGKAQRGRTESSMQGGAGTGSKAGKGKENGKEFRMSCTPTYWEPPSPSLEVVKIFGLPENNRVLLRVEDIEFAKQLVYCILYCTVGHCFSLFIVLSFCVYCFAK